MVQDRSAVLPVPGVAVATSLRSKSSAAIAFLKWSKIGCGAFTWVIFDHSHGLFADQGMWCLALLRLLSYVPIDGIVHNVAVPVTALSFGPKGDQFDPINADPQCWIPVVYVH
eukprot:46806-Amphidinium_carterae.1